MRKGKISQRKTSEPRAICPVCKFPVRIAGASQQLVIHDPCGNKIPNRYQSNPTIDRCAGSLRLGTHTIELPDIVVTA